MMRLRWSWCSLTLVLCACGASSSRSAGSGGAGGAVLAGTSSSGSDGTSSSSSGGQGGGAGLLSCAGAGKATLSGDVQPIFNAQCVQCHGGPQPQDGLDLQAGKAWGSTVNVSSIECGTNYVTPNEPSQSYLVNKVTGIHICSDDQMPLGGMFPMAQMQTIIDWVCSGAPND
jgi:hypothetical protein